MDELDQQIQTYLSALASEGYGVSNIKPRALKRDIKFGISCGDSFDKAFADLDEHPGWEWYGIKYPKG